MANAVRAKVVRRRDEDFDSLMRRFRRQVNDGGILMECKRREFYMSKTEKAREKSKRARLRARKQNQGRFGNK